MRSTPFDNYQSNAGEAPFMRKWLLRALVISVLFHLGLIGFFRATKLERFTQSTERLVPRAFSVNRLSVNPELLKEDVPEAPATPKSASSTPRIDIPIDKPSADPDLDQMHATPLALPMEIAKPILNEKPQVDSTTMQQRMERLQQNSTKAMDAELNAATAQLLKDRPRSPNQSVFKADRPNTGGTSTSRPGAGAVSGFSNLDDLLGQAGGVKPGNRPARVPGGALFEYNSADLAPSAVELLRKLGTIIKRSPNVTFSIQGHTDTFGDDESNLRLSEARADSVRRWLVENMDVNPARVETQGFGSSKVMVAPKPYDSASQASIDAEKARQAPNRRVEIDFRFLK